MSLTKRLVDGRRRARAAAPRAARRPPDGSRARLLDAAKREFAARGFAGASVERIAAAARLNKAMIYYHFGSKAALYREILHDMFHAIAERTSAVARSSAPPDEKIRGFIDAIAAEADARPHFPAIWFREIAEEAAHLDETIVRELTRIIRTLAGIIQEGAEDGRFSPVNPLLIHAGIVAPLLLYFASRRLRARIERAGAAGAAGFDRDEVVAYLQRVSLGVLEGRM